MLTFWQHFYVGCLMILAVIIHPHAPAIHHTVTKQERRTPVWEPGSRNCFLRTSNFVYNTKVISVFKITMKLLLLLTTRSWVTKVGKSPDYNQRTGFMVTFCFARLLRHSNVRFTSVWRLCSCKPERGLLSHKHFIQLLWFLHICRAFVHVVLNLQNIKTKKQNS